MTEDPLLASEVLRIDTPDADAMEFTVILRESERGAFIADVPELPGCHTQGRTRSEALANVREAIELYLEVQGLPPLRKVSIEHVTVEA